MKKPDKLAVVYWPISKLKPYVRNPRKNDHAVDRMCESIKQFGFTIPVLVRKSGEVIDGHLRLKAAIKLELSEVPVILCDSWTEAQVKAFRLLVNRSVTWADWDADALAAEFLELKAMEFDLTLTGFDSREIDSFTLAANPAEDDVPPVPDEPITKPGDLWLLGEHRLLCGDSTDSESVARLMGATLAPLVFTSPPYDQQRDYHGKQEWMPLMTGAFSRLPVNPRSQVLVNLGVVHKAGEVDPYWEPWIASMQAEGWKRFAWYVWDQGPGLPGDWNGRLAPSHEFIFHFNKSAVRARKVKQCEHAGEKNHGKGLRNPDGSVSEYTAAGGNVQATKIPDSVFRITRHKARGVECEHPAVFPVRLAEEVIVAFSDSRETVYDPFLGSGTTVIAAESTGRICYGLELSPAYCDVIVTRWQNLTGKTATLEAR